MTELLLVGPRDGEMIAFQQMACAQDSTWSVLHSPDADSALALLERRPADIVLARFPVLADCESLFARVGDTTPGAIRLALQDQPPAKVKGAHQSLATRGDLTALHPILRAAADVAARAAGHEGLQRIMSRCQDVPSPPLLYFDLREQLDSASGTAASMAEIAGRDPALVAGALRLANSGFYARPRTIGNLTDAIGLIGADALLGLVLAAQLYTGLPPPGLRLESLWQHAVEVSALARQISRLERGSPAEVSHSFIAGLLHDIGLMVLLQNESARYQPLLHRSGGDESELTRMEEQAFGITHSELGALILTLWNLPAPVVDAVANSHPGPAGDAGPDEPLALTSRAVLAAEWLLDREHPQDLDELPRALSATPEASIRRWFDARDQLVTGQ